VLYTRLEQEASATDNPVTIQMFTLIGDSLRETAATPAQRAALYQVAARLPGVELVGSVKDRAGRPGVAVALSDHAVRSTLIFDPVTSALLAEEQAVLAGNPYGYPASTRTGYATYLVQKIVNSSSQVLADHAAQRHPHEVRAVESESVQQPDRIAGHLIETVGRARVVEIGRQPDIPVVEADHPVPGSDEGVDQLRRPPDRRRVHPHDQDHRCATRPAPGLVPKPQPVRGRVPVRHHDLTP